MRLDSSAPSHRNRIRHVPGLLQAVHRKQQPALTGACGRTADSQPRRCVQPIGQRLRQLRRPHRNRAGRHRRPQEPTSSVSTCRGSSPSWAETASTAAFMKRPRRSPHTSARRPRAQPRLLASTHQAARRRHSTPPAAAAGRGHQSAGSDHARLHGTDTGAHGTEGRPRHRPQRPATTKPPQPALPRRASRLPDLAELAARSRLRRWRRRQQTGERLPKAGVRLPRTRSTAPCRGPRVVQARAQRRRMRPADGYAVEAKYVREPGCRNTFRRLSEVDKTLGTPVQLKEDGRPSSSIPVGTACSRHDERELIATRQPCRTRATLDQGLRDHHQRQGRLRVLAEHDGHDRSKGHHPLRTLRLRTPP